MKMPSRSLGALRTTNSVYLDLLCQRPYLPWMQPGNAFSRKTFTFSADQGSCPYLYQNTGLLLEASGIAKKCSTLLNLIFCKEVIFKEVSLHSWLEGLIDALMTSMTHNACPNAATCRSYKAFSDAGVITSTHISISIWHSTLLHLGLFTDTQKYSMLIMAHCPGNQILWLAAYTSCLQTQEISQVTSQLHQKAATGQMDRDSCQEQYIRASHKDQSVNSLSL